MNNETEVFCPVSIILYLNKWALNLDFETKIIKIR